MSLDPRYLSNQNDPRTPDPNEFNFVVDTYPSNVEDDYPGVDDEGSIYRDDSSSVITLEENFSDSHISPGDPLYGLPTHISSHGGSQLCTTSRTQPTTPVTTPYREQPNHPLRALTSTHLVLNQQLGTDESLTNSPIMNSALKNAIQEDEREANENQQEYEDDDENRNDSITERDDDDEESLDEEAILISQRQKQHQNDEWAEKGAAKLVEKTKNSVSGEEEELIIKKSVKDFKFGKTLGVGSYSTVLLATDKNTQKKFAVKVLDKRHIIREKKVKYVNIEKNTLNRLGKREGIIHLFFTFQDESSLYFVLDYASGGELLTLIKEHGTLNEDTVRYYGAQIVDAIQYMHDNGVVHRDLKPENILLDERLRIQVTDFGTAKLSDKDENGNYPSDIRAKSFVGTAEYVCPELLNEKAVGKSCDIWAFGCIIYQMIAGKPPFKATNEYLTFQKIVKLQYAFTAGFPMVIRDLVKRILKLNPQDRLTLKEIQNHHFFNGIDFSDPINSIWAPDPPDVGPYKISAKSMLPVPELAGQKNRITVNVPRKVASSPSRSSAQSTPKSESNAEDSDESSTTSQSYFSQAPSASQQVLMKAKAAVAARKQQQLRKSDEKTRRNISAGSAANAASIALSRQPNDIIKAWNVSKEKKELQQADDSSSASSSSFIPTPPLSASSNITSEKRTISGTTPVNTTTTTRSVPHVTTMRKKPAAAPPKPKEIQPMTKLDLEFVDFLKTHDERVMRKESLNVQLTTVEVIEKKYKGRLVDSPLGGNKSSSSSLLSQVANGSYKGLRNMSQHSQESEQNIIINHIVDDEDKLDTAKTRFRKFFSSSSSQDDDKKNRLVIVTNRGRLLIFSQNTETSEDNEEELELRTEIDLTHPVIRIKELIPGSSTLSSSTATPSSNSHSLFVIESYSTAFTFDGKLDSISTWTRTLYNAKIQANEKLIQERLERDPSGYAGTTLGSDAAKSAANIATSPKLKADETFQRSSMETLKKTVAVPPAPKPAPVPAPSVSESKQKETSHKSNHMLRDLVRVRGSGKASAEKRELPGNGQLFHGLPVKLISGHDGSSSNKNPLIAAASAAISNSNGSSSSSSASSKANTIKKSSFNHEGGNASSSSTSQPRGVITGMNSRLLARSNDRRKKK